MRLRVRQGLDDVLDEPGAGRRPRVVADIDGYVMSASVGSMGGRALPAFTALDTSPEAGACFDGLASRCRKNFSDQITSAKQSATRGRRIAATIRKLRAGRTR